MKTANKRTAIGDGIATSTKPERGCSLLKRNEIFSGCLSFGGFSGLSQVFILLPKMEN